MAWEYLFRGNVQGVGFRWQTQRIADRHAVGGYVCNLPDGQVRLVVQGDRQEVQAFVGDLQRQMAGFIQDVESREFDAGEPLTTFEIRHA